LEQAKLHRELREEIKVGRVAAMVALKESLTDLAVILYRRSICEAVSLHWVLHLCRK
jgi:hypothetical protein